MNDSNKTIQDVLDQLVSYVNRHMHSSSCGIVKNIEDKKYTVSLFPVLTEEKNITVTCYALKGINVSLGDPVLVVFTDRSNKNSINELRKNSRFLSQLEVNGNLHSYNNGIIIGIIDVN